MDAISSFKKLNNYLVCVDSDGCAMDTMNVKHDKCFGPVAVEIWELQNVQEKFLETWNYVNLFSNTRGVNRFKGVVLTFDLMVKADFIMPDISELRHWTETSPELSNPALEKAISENSCEQLLKALEWSKEVNEAINKLPQEDKPFDNVKEGLEYISNIADIAIVSSANSEAVKNEWTRHGLMPLVKVMLGQEAGSKAACIQGLKENNYSDDHVLMVGDAPGDLDAALKNGVLYYPILVGKEAFSWERLSKEGVKRLLDGTYRGGYQQKLIKEFNEVLK